MSEIKIFELSEVMPTYWTDGINTIPLLMVEEEIEPNQDQSQTENIPLPKRKFIEVVRVIRNTTESKKLKELYKNICQVCNETLSTRDGFYSEAHHLQPLGADHKGPDIQSNMIVVCPNHHALFDSGAIAIIPETLEVISYNGNIIGSLSLDPKHLINEKFIKYHFEKRFKKLS